MYPRMLPNSLSHRRARLPKARSLAVSCSTAATIRCSRGLDNALPSHHLLQADFWAATPRSTDGTWRDRNIFVLNGTPFCSSTAKSRLYPHGGTEVKRQFSSGSIWEVRITCADFRF